MEALSRVKQITALSKLLFMQAKHGKALQAARTSKRGSAETDAALLSLESLHKQVCLLAPFPMFLVYGFEKRKFVV